MGASSSKNDGKKALLLCKERLRFIKQAIDLRYALSAAQLSYTQSLRNMGAALRQFTEAEILVDPSQSNFAPGQSTPQSSCPSPSPFLTPELLGSPHVGVTSSPRLSGASYMRAAGSASVKFSVDTSSNHYVDEEGDDSLTFPMPPPPPFPEIDSSWDFFDPIDAVGSIKIPNCEYAMKQHFGKFAGLRQNVSPREEANASQGKELLTQYNIHSLDVENSSAYKATRSMVVSNSHSMNNYNLERSPELENSKGYCGVNGSAELVARTLSPELCGSKIEKSERDKQKETEWEDSSKLVSHKAKDFMSSVKEIEHGFIRASESGHEVSRMLETKKIRLSVQSEILRKSSDSFLPVLHLVCCKTDNLSERDTIHHVTKIITWRRSVSSLSSSSRNNLTAASKDDEVENGNDFVEEFSMISGSHSSTLDRLYAWERKLYDELKIRNWIYWKGGDMTGREGIEHEEGSEMAVEVLVWAGKVGKPSDNCFVWAVTAVNKRISERIRHAMGPRDRQREKKPSSCSEKCRFPPNSRYENLDGEYLMVRSWRSMRRRIVAVKAYGQDVL
ncbi:hypothetical protein KSP40_PGU008816 [Platanthera guangdongensis]|uniref:Uncharacterized protein n=1 Tax=Platanthera guangdongensis TaxID=2320717 RepID=A0ABR2MP56_9ASPA